MRILSSVVCVLIVSLANALIAQDSSSAIRSVASQAPWNPRGASPIVGASIGGPQLVAATLTAFRSKGFHGPFIAAEAGYGGAEARVGVGRLGPLLSTSSVAASMLRTFSHPNHATLWTTYAGVQLRYSIAFIGAGVGEYRSLTKSGTTMTAVRLYLGV